MDKITTKELRERMPAVIKALREGRTLQITYRRKIVGSLQPQPGVGALRRGSPKAIKQFLNTHPFGTIPAALKRPGLDFKQEMAELRRQDIGAE